MKFITENIRYKIYSIYESIYLKDKTDTHNQEEFSKCDKFIGCHYGNPNNGIITEDYVIVSGCGISIYNLNTGEQKHLLDSEENRYWINGLHQEDIDNKNIEFRFVSYNPENKLRVFKMNVLTNELVELI